ncbi:MAG: histidine--tRNA ligase [Candidatus Omnitrophica bacterium]|nr:histidine--tRNA ligase [Candidatus Omnitrophota bacterium]
MAARLEALGGTSDLLPEEASRWQAVEQKARQVLHRYGFQEIRTPIMETAEVFLQSLGVATEIVQKQMYLFNDRGDRRVALRPEGTASAVRAFLEHGMDKTSSLTKWYYVGPMFRAERPQAGRRRQFHQVGVEVFGSASPHQDAEVMAMLMHLLKSLGIRGAMLMVNNLGCRNDRPKMLEYLKTYFLGHHMDLCPDCKQRLEVNPLRILDCKIERCRSIAKGSMQWSKWLCKDCADHYDKALASLRTVGVECHPDPHLVRGLDYYTKTAFEVVYPGLGAQNAIGAGGRYDDLVERMGGQPTPAVGFAIGLERVMMALEAEQVAIPPAQPPAVYVAALGEQARGKALELLQHLRAAGIAAVGEFEAHSLRRQMENANRQGCPIVLMIGDDELAKGTVTLRDMATRSQAEATWEGCVDEVLRRLRAAA